ncbi:MAG: sarcosine oxidase subunit gamma family protein [Paracoccaceae bacterium]|nr:sarcosine oxidase subunit gamma family protein [Paracoccaceae bacterium]
MAALKARGFVMPPQRRLTGQVGAGHVGAGPDGRGAGWMSPDELLLILPYAAVAQTLDALCNALKGKHFLAVDVSDARAVFRVEGARSAQVLAKLCPVDLPRLEKDELRRTRAAQVAVAFWADDAGYTLVSFRSVADYVMGLLRHAARPGSALE